MNSINNFLDATFFNDLKTFIMESEFSWFQRKNYVVTGTTDNLGYFTHSFYNNQINCDVYFKYIIPILKKIKFKSCSRG